MLTSSTDQACRPAEGVAARGTAPPAGKVAVDTVRSLLWSSMERLSRASRGANILQWHSRKSGGVLRWNYTALRVDLRQAPTAGGGQAPDPGRARRSPPPRP
ncbi:MAG TPA: hypothetical protein VFT63_03495, partial [bacterium]|nr:hypothetical protein [bacterium]